MRVTIYKIPIMGLEKFAELHNLELEIVKERSSSPSGKNTVIFKAFFKQAKILKNTEGMLTQNRPIYQFVYGIGETLRDAVDNYISMISGRIMKDSRKEVFMIPDLFVEYEDRWDKSKKETTDLEIDWSEGSQKWQ